MDKIPEIEKQVKEAIVLRYSNPTKSFELGVNILKESLFHNSEKGRAYAHAIIGFAKYMQQKSEEGFEQLTDALEYFVQHKEEVGYPLTANAFANYYDVLGDYNKALQFASDGYQAAKQTNDEEFQADLLSTKGLIYSRISDYEQAFESHKKALAIREKLDLVPAMASSLNLIARTQVLAKDYEEAKKYYQQSIDLRLKHDDKSGLIWSYIGMASLHIETCEMELAIKYYNKALVLNNEINDTRADFLISKGIAKSYIISKEFNKAKEYLPPLMELAKSINSKPLLYQAYLLFSEYYSAIGDYATAFQYYKDYNSLKDEVLSEQTLNKLNQQQAAFEIEQSKKEAEIHRLKHVVLKKAYQEIKDSISYAEKIQQSLLPNAAILDDNLSEYFILFKPKDVVSGDYYWFKKNENILVITAADCTGHGVPGALMSMLGVSFLNEILSKKSFPTSNVILNQLREKVKKALQQKGDIGESKDGMDIALCSINLDTLELQYSGAYNPLFLIRNNELMQFSADHQPIGIYVKEQPFTMHAFQLEKNDCLYLFSDGYADQFGGPDEKKFMSKNFKSVLLENHSQPMVEQKKILDSVFETWKKGYDQMDDVLVIGLRI